MATAKPKPIAEPRRVDLICELASYLQPRVRQILDRMRARGFDPQVFETYRTEERQAFLYGKGRTAKELKKAHIDKKWAQPDLPKVTYTMQSLHRRRKAVDIISKSRHWSWPAFFKALEEEAAKEDMHTLGFEKCHVEWQG